MAFFPPAASISEVTRYMLYKIVFFLSLAYFVFRDNQTKGSDRTEIIIIIIIIIVIIPCVHFLACISLSGSRQQTMWTGTQREWTWTQRVDTDIAYVNTDIPYVNMDIACGHGHDVWTRTWHMWTRT